MSTALVVVALLLALPVLLLAVPWRVAFRCAGLDDFGGRLDVRWLFGAVRFGIDIPAATDRKREPVERAPRARRAPQPGRRGGGRRLLAVLRDASFRRRVVRLLKDLVAAAHPRQLRLHVRLGLGDPAATGRLWGLVGPLDQLARRIRDADVRLEPEFVDPVLEFDARGRLLLVPLQVIALAVAFALSPAALRAWWTLARGT